MAGDYDVFSRYLEKDAERFFRPLGVTPGTRLLDVGCGGGEHKRAKRRDLWRRSPHRNGHISFALGARETKESLETIPGVRAELYRLARGW